MPSHLTQTGGIMTSTFVRSRMLPLGMIVFAVVAAVSAQRPVPAPTQLLPTSVYGPDLYQFYCASCHGRDGRGAGPVAPALKLPVPDLTMMASRERGVFPRARVNAIVSGAQAPPIPAHGSREMPVWGPVFRALDTDTARNAMRVENLVAYVESIQVRTR